MNKVEDVRRLNEATGVGLAAAKQALEDADGDFDQAYQAMLKKGLAKADRRADRPVGAGIIQSYVHDGRIGVLVEIGCETDFVAKNELFLDFAKNLALQLAACPAANADEFLAQEYLKDSQLTIDDYRQRVMAQLGENLVIGQLARVELGQPATKSKEQ